MLISNITKPYIGYPGTLEEPILIKDELTYKMAKLPWGSIAEIYERKPVPDPIFEEIEREQREDKREENLARSVIPSDELKPKKEVLKLRPKGNTHGKHKQHGDLQLTVTFSEDKKEYQRQWSLCRKHGFVTYPEALKLDEEWKKRHDKQGKPVKTVPEKAPKEKLPKDKKPVKKVTCPDCGYSCDPRALHLHKCRKPDKHEEPVEVVPKPFPKPPEKAGEVAVSSEEPEFVIEGADSIIDSMPAEPTASRKEIRQGCKVKQIGGSKIFTGIGTVKRCPQGKTEVLVQFDNGMEWFRRDHLTLVEAAPA